MHNLILHTSEILLRKSILFTRFGTMSLPTIREWRTNFVMFLCLFHHKCFVVFPGGEEMNIATTDAGSFGQ